MRRLCKAELIFDAIGSAYCITQGLPSYLSLHLIQIHQELVELRQS